MVLRLSSFPSDVRGVVLTGLSTATNAVVAATDTVLAALGKLQAQLANYTLNAAAAITGGTIAGVTVSNAVLNTAALDTSLDLNFLSGVLDSRITFTRASIATYFDANGVMQTAAANVARFDHAPAIVDSASAPYVYTPLGLLIEESRTNLLLNSATLSTQSVTVTATAYTLSFYGTGTVTLTGTSTAGPLVGTGAFPARVSLTFTPTAGTLTLTVTGSVLNAQLEAASFQTSWISTAGAAVTRAADVATMPVGSWYSATAGTLGVEDMVPAYSAAIGQTPLEIDDGTSNNRITLYHNAGPNASLINVVGGSVVWWPTNIGSEPAAIINKAAFSFGPGGITVAINGANLNSNGGLAANTAFNRLALGFQTNGWLSGYIRRVRYWPRALSTAELQAVTATATPALLNLAIDQCPIGATNPSSGAFTTITLSQAEIDASAYTTAPVTSGTVTIPGTAARCVINPAGTLAALTVVSPAALSLAANAVQSLDILFTQAITALTWTAGTGTSFGGAAMPTTVALGTCVRLLWVQSLSKWLHTVEV